MSTPKRNNTILLALCSLFFGQCTSFSSATSDFVETTTKAITKHKQPKPVPIPLPSPDSVAKQEQRQQDRLNRKYPERIEAKAVRTPEPTPCPACKSETVTVKNYTLKDSIILKTRIDSLLVELYKVTVQYKDNQSLRAELDAVKRKLMGSYLGSNKPLHDTLIYFSSQRLYLQVRRLQGGRNQFTLTEGEPSNPPAPVAAGPAQFVDRKQFYQYYEYWYTVAIGVVLIFTSTYVKKHRPVRHVPSRRRYG